MTFNTRNGLKIWLEEAFHISSESDFSVGEGIIEGLKLQEEQVARLKEALAVNWTPKKSLQQMPSRSDWISELGMPNKNC